MYLLSVILLGFAIFFMLGWTFEYLARRNWEWKCARRDVDLETLRSDFDRVVQQRNIAVDQLAAVRRLITVDQSV